ncbi:MAG TPA: S41 family peptidase [Ideonella sp.]|nr:S41 family peptidase [Ideonella sp.]
MIGSRLRRHRIATIGLTMFMGLGLMAAALPVGASPRKSATMPQPERWRAMAVADLKAARQAIEATHPGMIDAQNPRFRDWVARGYDEALALAPRVNSYDSALSLVRYYTSGFYDGHLGYSDDVRNNAEPILSNGWTVFGLNGHFEVVATAPQWPTPLPPIGARLVDCDGRSPRALIEEDAAPYLDRRDLPELKAMLAMSLVQPRMPDLMFGVCRFDAPESGLLELPISYHPLPAPDFFALMKPPAAPARPENRFELKDGTLWIHAANFNLGHDEAAALDTMLRRLRELQGVERIVFDSRGNGGGSSAVGDRIFEAATGGLEIDLTDAEQLPRTHAQWRVSDIALATAAQHVKTSAETYGETSEQATRARDFQARLKAARAAGQEWLEQPVGPLVTRTEAARRHAHLRRFSGPVALVTDARCASACLDFADTVRQVPGAVHVGRTTSSDTVYIDIGFATLPSGNRLFMPLKVWRNRTRGNNEALVPDVPFDGDIGDDEAVKRATLAALGAASG